MRIPSVGTVADSIGDGAIEVVELPVRAVANVSGVGTTYINQVKSNLEAIKSGMPGNPAVIPEVGIKAVGQTVDAGIGLLHAIGSSLDETVRGVQTQIRRVTG